LIVRFRNWMSWVGLTVSAPLDGWLLVDLAVAPPEDAPLVGLAEVVLVKVGVAGAEVAGAEVAGAALAEAALFAGFSACREKPAGQLTSSRAPATSNPLLTREAIPCTFLVFRGALEFHYVQNFNIRTRDHAAHERDRASRDSNLAPMSAQNRREAFPRPRA
jgi:hypothetical protein